MKYCMNLQNVETKQIYPLSDKFLGKNPKGDTIGFTNYYMTKNDKPCFGISGEIHFSRVSDRHWKDELIKMKMCGINIISTYVFWIHHEEVEGRFRFDGRRNLRKFIKICQELDLQVIVRIGPFDHGEVRNGGLPDWLYGKPFEVRSLDEGFLHYTRELFRVLGSQMKGLFYKDGGPIIAAQIDNEYMHSAAPWEITTGISNEWVPGGQDGNAYMLRIKELAIEAGIDVPFYTCTGWGGAKSPSEEMLPLWGGYAFWPWIFYSHKGEHPATPEYIYRDFHNNNIPMTYNFEPTYLPESLPYACCEMGGGMSNFYHYRFQLPYESVAAMANVKLASGCNLLGYYMFKGGTNPLGEKTPFLNEGQVTKLSYDYQAAIGEFGQIRPSYKQLKALHMFVDSFATDLCRMKTVLPEGAQDIEPLDVTTLRYAVRVVEQQGFVFINNYQDHATLEDKNNDCILLKLEQEDIEMTGISLAAGESAILPFNMTVGEEKLKYATAQPLKVFEYNGLKYYVFSSVDGLMPKYYFEGQPVVEVNSKETTSFFVPGSTLSKVVHLSKEDAMNLYCIKVKGQDTLVITNATLLYEEKTRISTFRLECNTRQVSMMSFPPCEWYTKQIPYYNTLQQDIFTGFSCLSENENLSVELQAKQVGPNRYTTMIPEDAFTNQKEVFLLIDYIGDIGHAFINGVMISDHFCNGATWEIGLSEYKELLRHHSICILITPLKEGICVNVDSAMAARLEEVDQAKAVIQKLSLRKMKELSLSHTM